MTQKYYLSKRQLHISICIEVVASYCLSDLSDMCWWRWTNGLLLLCGRHSLFMCVEEGEIPVRPTRAEKDAYLQDSHTVFQLHTYFYIWHRKYSNPSAVLPFIPVVVYLSDDVHWIALLKCQLPATCSCQNHLNQHSTFHLNSISYRTSATVAGWNKIKHNRNQLSSCLYLKTGTNKSVKAIQVWW